MLKTGGFKACPFGFGRLQHYISVMGTPIRISGLTAIMIMAGTLPAMSQTVAPIIVPQMTNGDLQNLRNRQQRENFRLQQQFNRDLNNLEMRQRQPRIEVPVMKPRCSPQKVGISC